MKYKNRYLFGNQKDFRSIDSNNRGQFTPGYVSLNNKCIFSPGESCNGSTFFLNTDNMI